MSGYHIKIQHHQIQIDMKFSGTIEVNRSIELVTGLFADPRYLKEYQEGFQKKELVSGEAGKDGAVSKMYYAMGKRSMELTETITANRLPATFEASYHHKHMDNTLKCTFTALDGNRTRYHSEVEYTRINWLMPKLIALLFPGMYRKQAEKWLHNFKNFVENYPQDEA